MFPERRGSDGHDFVVSGNLTQELRATFEQVPHLYDRARPNYPPELFGDLAELARLREDARIVEIGCGTTARVIVSPQSIKVRSGFEAATETDIKSAHVTQNARVCPRVIKGIRGTGSFFDRPPARPRAI